jgi:NADH dehydrogenase
VKVGPDLSLHGHPEVFVIGDTASAPGPDGRPLPGVAPVAKQQGRYVAAVLGVPHPVRLPFRYRDYGSMATIGRKHAVAEIGRVRLTGFIAWLVWCVAHIWFLIGFRNRFVVAANWLWNYMTFQRGTRLIVGSDEPVEAPEGAGPAVSLPPPVLRSVV